MVDGEWHSWENLTMQDTEAQMAAQKEAFAILSERCEGWKRLARIRRQLLVFSQHEMRPPSSLLTEYRQVCERLGEDP